MRLVKMDRDKILTELLVKSDGKCMRCGKELRKKDAVIDHIFPVKYGGSGHIENLRVVCKACNNLSANRFSQKESEFQQYLQKLLLSDARFHNVCVDKQVETTDGQKITADIIFSRTVHGREESYIIEAKSSLATTRQGIESAIRQLKYYQSVLPNLHFILAVSTPIAEEYRSCVYNSGFTLWDSEIFRTGIPDKEIPMTLEKDIYMLN